ncbi:MAG: DUF739 family protein [Clostridia bacterium]|nr:DUF739 family protein [Clostridia bacterium]
MRRDYTELRKKIRGKYLKLEDFAKDLGISVGTLTLKLAGKSEWSRMEIERTAILLDLTPDEILEYFF